MFRRSALTILALLSFAACSKIPLKPAKPLPPGTVVLRFSKAVAGPLDLAVDGTRVPVAQGPKGGKFLRIEGLKAGQHKLFISSPRDAFSPDQAEITLPDDGGYYDVVFAQRFNAVLYGKPPEVPAAEGLPGVKASLLAK
ncbi:MAG TPA: hypothetical protein VJ623_09640 [Holophagaceae bacterium]|nr:hypothetical protein [Holophagaceae bacterium]